jgi:hypothetical protein
VAKRSGPALVPLGDVVGYDVTNHLDGAVQGAGWGLLGGIGVGALAGFIAGDDPPCDPNTVTFGCALHYSAGDKALIGGFVGAVIGTLAGSVVGAIVGYKRHYVFW